MAGRCATLKNDQLPEDFARRVSVNLHKCSVSAVIFEKVQF
jgi:hypothetical protein